MRALIILQKLDGDRTLHEGDFRYFTTEDGTVGMSFDGFYSTRGLPQIYVAWKNPTLVHVDYQELRFKDVYTGDEMSVIPYDYSKQHSELTNCVALKPILVESEVPNDSEGDSNCKHELQDDGDNFQIVCTKCGLRSSVFLEPDSDDTFHGREFT